MCRRDRTALALPPLLLRVLLGVTFFWAGLGKFAGEVRVSGERAAVLANMGVDLSAAAADPMPPSPIPAPIPAPVPAPVRTPADPAAPAPAPTTDPAADPASTDPMPADGFRSPGGPSAGRAWAGTDFPTEVSVRRLYGLALMVHDAANPKLDEQGRLPAGLWPRDLAAGSWPVWLAWGVTMTELVGGVMVLAGMLTRVWALGFAAVMLGAMWLTQFGPALRSGTTVLGILPAHAGAWAPDAAGNPVYGPLLWQFALLMASLALALSRPGALAVDSAIFGRGSRRAGPDGV